MRYTRFKKLYRQIRQQATPDVRDQVIADATRTAQAPGPYLPPEGDGPPTPGWRHTPAVKAAAAAAAVLLVAGTAIGVGTQALRGRGSIASTSLPGSSAGPTTAATSTTDDGLSLPYVDDPVFFLNYQGFETMPGHTECGGVYYDFASRSLFCLKERMAACLKEAGTAVKESAIYIHTYNDVGGLVLFSIDGQAGRPGYCLNLKTGRCYQTGFSMNNTPGLTTLPLLPDADAPYIACIKDTAVYLIDGRDGKTIDIGAKNGKGIAYDSTNQVTFSPDGRYLQYPISGDGTSARTALYAIDTGRNQIVTGEILHFTHDGRYLLYRTKEGVFALACASGKSVPVASAEDLPAYELVEVCRKAGTPIPNYDDYGLEWRDLVTGETQAITDAPIHAHTIGGDGRYLYYYRRGEAYIHRLDLATHEEAAVRVDAGFLAETTSEAVQGCEIVYYLYAHQHTGELLLEYILTPLKQMTEEAYAASQDNDPDVQYDSQWAAAGSLSDMEDFIRRFSRFLTFYRGDGFAVMAYHPEMGQLHVAFEDYRTGRLYRFYYLGRTFDSKPNLYDEPKPLKTDLDGKELEALLAQLPFEDAPAPLDYGTLLTQGKLDEKKLFAWSIDTDRLMAATRQYYVQRTGQSLMADLTDREELRTFLTFAETRSYTPSKLDYMAKKTYELVIQGQQDTIGEPLCLVMDGNQPYLYYGGYQSALSQEAYRQWYAWFERMNVEVPQ